MKQLKELLGEYSRYKIVYKNGMAVATYLVYQLDSGRPSPLPHTPSQTIESKRVVNTKVKH
jgi:hypothetical protein